MRTAIPKALRRRLLFEAGYQCAICQYPAVHLHHIIPYTQCQSHEYDNLIAVCPNHHTLIHEKKISSDELRKYKSRLITSSIHERILLHVDHEKPFSGKWGPSKYTDEEKHGMIINLNGRGQLAGCITHLNWPLLRCDICKHVVPMDSCYTLQDNCLLDYDERLEVFCGFGCSSRYQELIRENQENYYMYSYYLQNFVEILGITMTHKP